MLVWKFSTDQLVHILSTLWSILRIKEDQQVHVRKTSLLKLDGEHTPLCLSKNPLLVVDVLQQGFTFQIEYAGHYVRMIRSSLPFRKSSQDLWPFWVGCHGNEEVGITRDSGQGHGVLVVLS